MKPYHFYSEEGLKWIEAHTGKIGLYALYHKERCVYVGKAECLFKRLRTHLRRRRDITTVATYDLTSEMNGLSYDERKHLHAFRETVLIQKLKPIENIKRPMLSPECLWKMPIKVQEIIINGLPSLTQPDT